MPVVCSDDPYAESAVLNWADFTVAYACSTCFDEATIARMGQAASAMRGGSYLIASSVHIDDDPAWELVDQFCCAQMSWGVATLFIHRRREKGEEEEWLLRKRECEAVGSGGGEEEEARGSGGGGGGV